MDKEEKDTNQTDDYFYGQLPKRSAPKESIDKETVRVIEKAPVIHNKLNNLDKLAKVKGKAQRKKSEPFYEKYLKDKKAKIGVMLNFDAASIQQIIPVFAEYLKFNYSIDPAVKGNVTLNVHEVGDKTKELMMTQEETWKLFEQILWMAGSYCSPESDILHIMPFQKMSRERNIFKKSGSKANVEVRIFDIHNVPASNVLGQLVNFITEGARATELSGQNAIMVIETPDNMHKLETLIKMLDTSHRSLWPRILIQCSNVSSSNVVSELSMILPVLGFPVTVDNVVAEPGSIHLQNIDRLEMIIASAANKEALDEIIKWVKVLDRSDVGQQEQIYIYKVVNSKAEELVEAISSIFNVEGTSMSFSGSSTRSKKKSSSSRKNKVSTSSIKSRSRRGNKEGFTNIFEVPVKIFADGKNNRLLIRTTPRTYAMIKALLTRLDTVPTQVLLQVLIAEVRLNENTEFGMEFSGVSKVGGWNGVFGTNFADLVPQTPKGINQRGFKYMISAGQDKYAYIRGIAGSGNFKVLSSPQIAAVSGTEATLDVGQEVPIVTKTISDTNSGSSALATSNDVEYKKIGVMMKITPQVTKGGLITIELDQIVSARGEDVLAGGQSYPSFINREVITSLSMRDGSTLLIGGIIQELDRSKNDSVPLIAKMPILKNVFGYNTYQKERTELILMITASVIHEDSNLQKLVKRYKNSIKLIKDFNKRINKTSKKKKAKK
jgi:general secretion pathway protein D